MSYMEFTGKNIDEAKEEAQKELKLNNPDELKYEVIEEGSSGILGLGTKEAKIRVQIASEDLPDKIKQFLQGLFSLMEIEASQKIAPTEDGGIKVDLDGEELAVLIGQKGTTLDALQLLTNVIINKGAENKTKITIDAKRYKEKKERSLKDFALRQADKVKQEKRNIILNPMPPNERRIVHLALQDHPFVKTYSSGEEPMRKVIISLKEE